MEEPEIKLEGSSTLFKAELAKCYRKLEPEIRLSSTCLLAYKLEEGAWITTCGIDVWVSWMVSLVVGPGSN